MQVEEESIIERDWTFAGASLVHGSVEHTYLTISPLLPR